jgi:hypothetical protein
MGKQATGEKSSSEKKEVGLRKSSEKRQYWGDCME